MTVDIVEAMARGVYEQHGSAIPWSDAPELHCAMWRSWVRVELQQAAALAVIRQAFPQSEAMGG